MVEKKRKVCVTGIGVVAPNGKNRIEYMNNCLNGVTGIKKSNYLKNLGLVSEYAGELESDITDKKEKYYDISKKAIIEMLDDAGLTKEDIVELGERASISFSSCNYLSYCGELALHTQARNEVSIKGDTGLFFRIIDLLGAKGVVNFSNAACASGTLATGVGYDLITYDEADLVIVGGADVFSDVSLGGFHILQSMSKDPCKPFDKNRLGLSIGEAAAYLVLESEEHAKKRGAHIYAEIVGVESRNDAYHMTSPDPEGQSEFRCMQALMDKFELNDDSVVYVNAHGTATKANDNMEMKVFKRLIENNKIDSLRFSSTKSMIGHCLGVAGAVELALCCMCIEKGEMPLSISVDEPDDIGNAILVTSKEQSVPYEYCISNSFAFAGNCACVGIKKYNE